MTPFKTIQNLSAEVAESYCPSGNADTNWHASGIIDFNASFNRYIVGSNLPLVTEGADEQVGRGRSQHIDRNAAAVLLDWNLRRLSQGKAVIDLRLGELLVEFRKRHPEKLGFVRLVDYTREEMGIPWRSASLLVSNWTALEKLPGLMRAHREGLISKSKLRFLLRVATAENEEVWIEKASKVSVKTLEDLVKAEETRRNGGGSAMADADSSGSAMSDADDSGSALSDADAGNSGSDTESVPDGRASEPDGKLVPAACNLSSCREDDRAGYLMSLITTPEKAAIWDSALEHFRGYEGGDFSTETFIEALLAEFCSALPLPEDRTFSDAAGTVNGEIGTDADGSVDGKTDTDADRTVDGGPAAEIAAAHPNPSDTTAEHPYYSDAVSRHFNPQAPLDSAQAAIDTPLPQSRHWRRITGDEDGEFLSCDSCDGREADEERERWMMVRKDLEDVTKIWEYLSWTPVTVETPLEWDDALVDIRAVADMIKKIVAMRQLVGFYMGRILRTVENLHLYTDMQFASFNHYVVERLGISMRTARNLIKLVRSFLSLPILEGAFKDGVLTQQRAHLLLKVATEKTEAEWMKYGTEVPVLDLEREVKRLSRLIEANSNLLDAYLVLPGFSPSEKVDTEASSAKDTLKAQVAHREAAEKTAGKMCATEILSEAEGPEMTDSSRKMCATEMLPAPTSLEYLPENAPPENESPENEPSGKMCATDAGSACCTGKGTGTIRFFIPDSLIPLWNYAFIRYLDFAAGSETAPESTSSTAVNQVVILKDQNVSEIPPDASTHPTYSDDARSHLEGFLFSLIYHYLDNERAALKKLKRRLRHKVIERDNFRCIIPGCSSRAGLDDHHIRFRSHGGSNKLSNNSSTCFEHHRHCIHDNRYITIKGKAPDNLTVAMGVEPGRPPFALFINGRRVCSNDTETGGKLS
ncbi:MAG: HNH endonuclease [Candidatus Xenobiia bacterium LiM19]